MCQLCGKLLNRHTCAYQGVKNVSDVILVFLLLTLNIFHTFSSISIVDFERINVSWVVSFYVPENMRKPLIIYVFWGYRK